MLVLPASALVGQADTARRTTDSTARPQSLAPVIVSASRLPTRSDRLGVSASVLTAADFKVEPVLSIADVVSRLPGVYMDANAGPGGPTNIRLRGADESFTKVLVDGVEVNVSGGPFRFQGMTASNIDRVELVRGPQSALHGSNAMAGVVSLFTAPGQPGAPHWKLDTEGGAATENGNHGGATASVAGGSGVFLYSVGGGLSFDEGIYDVHHNLRTQEGSTRLDFDPSGMFSLTGTLRFNHMKSQLPVRNPGTTRVPLDPNQRDENNMLVTGLTATLAPSPLWTHQLRLGVFRDVFSYTDQLDVVPKHDSIPYFNGDAYTSTNLVRANLAYDATRRFIAENGHSASVTLGGLVERETTGDTVGGAFGSGFTPQHRNHGSLFSEINASAGDMLSVLVGARLEDYEGLGSSVIPRASLRARIVPDHLSLRAAVGRGFKAPNIEQQFTANDFIIPNPNLKPETSWSAEGGADYTLSSEFSVSATYFKQRFTGLIEVVPAPAPETRLISKNVAKTDANGVELEARWNLPSGVRASGNFSWIHTSIIDNSGLAPAQFPVDSALPSRPEFIAGGTLDVPLGRLHAFVRATGIGRDIVLTEIFSGSRRTLDPYALLGLTLSYDVARGLTLYTRGDNLLNTYYVAGFDRRGVPRALTVGLRASN